MGAEQILIVAVLALVIAAALIAVALFTRKNVEGSIELPPGIKIRIKGTESADPQPGQLAAIKEVIWQHNTDFAAVVNGVEGTILARTTTHTELPMIYQRIESVRRSNAQYSILGCVLRDIQWKSIETLGPATAQVTTNETWDYTFQNGAKQEQRARNIYLMKNVNGAWLIDSSETISTK